MSDSSSIRARDVKPRLKEKGFEAGVVLTLEMLCEHVNVQEKRLAEIATHLLSMAEIVTNMTAVGEQMKATIEQINTKYSDKEDINTYDQ